LIPVKFMRDSCEIPTFETGRIKEKFIQHLYTSLEVIDPSTNQQIPDQQTQTCNKDEK